MIRRILSLLVGGVACWALYALIARAVLGTTAAELLLGASGGSDGFFFAAVPALASFLAVHLLISHVPLFKRGWMSAGAFVIAAALCLYALLLMGSGLISA